MACMRVAAFSQSQENRCRSCDGYSKLRKRNGPGPYRCEDRVLDGPASGEMGWLPQPEACDQEFKTALQGYLAHKKQRPPRSLHQDYT